MGHLLGQALGPFRDQMVIATKFGIRFYMDSPAVNKPLIPDSRPEVIRASVEGSLRRLNTDHISSRYWNMVHGNTPEQVRQDLEGVQIMHILGKNMAFFLKCREAGLAVGVALPEQETISFTNFIR